MKNIEHSKVLSLKEEVIYQKGQVVSKTLYQSKSASVTLFAFSKGEGLTKHTSSGDALVMILDGEVVITIGDEEYHLKEGNSILMPRNIPHALFAINPFKMILTIAFEN